MNGVTKREHQFAASAHVLSGSLQLPFAQEITPQAHVSLKKKGGYFSEEAHDVRVENVISFRHAWTQTAGNLETKPGHGWSTLSTSVIEGLNILEVVTADRVVAQIGTEHPLEGYVPTVTFLGTRFENLRVAGNPIRVELDLDILGPKPKDDGSYLTSSYFKQGAGSKCRRFNNKSDMPPAILERYNELPGDSPRLECVECSLVKKLEGGFPGKSYGSVLEIPHFGKVSLATLYLCEWDFIPGTETPKNTEITLNMIELEMGCLATGTGTVGSGVVNGKSYP